MRRIFILLAAGAVAVMAPAASLELDNPVSVEYLQENLAKTHPRLVFTPSILREVKSKLKTDPVVQNWYAAIRLSADAICKEPLLKREVIGWRMLGTSREMLYRINMLGAVYLIEKDQAALHRINEELLTVCEFADWNPGHFLDVAEMSLAVALALDWTDGDLPASTSKKAKAALIEKGLNPSWPLDGKKWRYAYLQNNWNQVCNGGLIAAAISIAEENPELAAKTIARALDGMPNALAEYMPDGVYPEGSSYWGYGTGYSVITIAMLESAFGRDFGISAVPGFMESAMFRLFCNAPSGLYFNFSDCDDKRGLNGDIILAWFAMKTGNKAYFEKERFMRPVDNTDTLFRHGGAALAWLSQYEERASIAAPADWKGAGSNPVAVFTGGKNDPHQYYFGGKGGRATTNHGNMDAGSFVFELNGVRWVIDSGNQSYNTLEEAGFELWGKKQDSQRWALLSKNNFGHSTLTVNNQPFVVDGYAPLIGFKTGGRPAATFDLSSVYGDNVQKAERCFIKDSPASLVVKDWIVCSESTREIVWQLMTAADVEPVDGGAILSSGGQRLRLDIQTPRASQLSVVSLDPPPMKLDRRIKGLKRIEIRPSTKLTAGRAIQLVVRLSEDNQR